MTIIHALPDCLIYIVLPLILAFRTFKDIHVFHSKEIYNKIEFWVYVLTILTASMLFRIGSIGFYPIIVTVVFFVMALQDYKETGKIEERIKQGMTSIQTQQDVEKQKKKAGHGSQALKKKRTNFLFVLTVAVLSLLNFFGVFNFLS
jgi:hypothetical protein